MIKKTFKITEVRNSQLEIMSAYLKGLGFQGTQTEILDKAIWEMYVSMRRTDLTYFEEKEKEVLGEDEEIIEIHKRIRGKLDAT